MSATYLRLVIANEHDESLAEVTLRPPAAANEPPLPPGAYALDSVWTDPACRGRGYAATLLTAAQELARGAGRGIACRPQAHGPGSNQRKLERLYRKLGWTRLLYTEPTWLYWEPAP